MLTATCSFCLIKEEVAGANVLYAGRVKECNIERGFEPKTMIQTLLIWNVAAISVLLNDVKFSL